MDHPPGGFAQTYGVELLFETPPSLSLKPVLDAIRRHCPAAEPLDQSGKGTVLAFLHPDHVVQLKDATIPPQTCVFPTDEPFQLTEALEDDLRQSRAFPEAREVVGRCRHSVLVTDLLSSPLEYKERLALFEDALAGVLEAVPASAVHWRPTGKFVSPARWLQAYGEGGVNRFFAGALTVRFYHISDAPGDMVG